MRTLGKGNVLFIPMLIIGILYFVIGFGVGISGFLTSFLKGALHLTVTESYLVPVAVFGAFVVFGAPAGCVVSKAGYKRSIVYSLLIIAGGMVLFVSSAHMRSLITFLLALFVVGIGKTLLQASVNPYVTVVGPPEGTVMRMCLMGILNKLAWWLCPVFLGLFLDLNQVELSKVSLSFYLVTGILVLLGVFTYYSPLPEVKAPGETAVDKEETNGSSAGKFSIFSFPHLFLGVLALFFYIGVEVLPMASAIDFARVVFGEGVTIYSFL